MVRVVLPYHLRSLAGISGEVELDVEGPASVKSILDALEARYPMLRGTIRDQVTGHRRALVGVGGKPLLIERVLESRECICRKENKADQFERRIRRQLLQEFRCRVDRNAGGLIKRIAICARAQRWQGDAAALMFGGQ